MASLCRTSFAVMFVLVPMFSSTTNGEILTYGFSGVITSIENDTDLPIHETFPIGSSWQMTYTFDTSIPLNEGGIGQWHAPYNIDGASSGRLFSATATFNGYQISQLSGVYGNAGRLELWDDYRWSESVTPEDRYIVGAAFLQTINATSVPSLVIDLREEHGDAHAGVSLNMQPDIGRYHIARMYIWSSNYLDGLGNSYAINGSVDRFFVVPEPAATLLLAGLAMPLITRRP